MRGNAEWARLHSQAMSVFRAEVALRQQRIDCPAPVFTNPKKPRKRVRFQLSPERPRELPRGLSEIIRGPSAHAPSH